MSAQACGCVPGAAHGCEPDPDEIAADGFFRTWGESVYRREMLAQLIGKVRSSARAEMAALVSRASDELLLGGSHYAHHDPKGTAGANCPACHASARGRGLLNEAMKLAGDAFKRCANCPNAAVPTEHDPDCPRCADCEHQRRAELDDEYAMTGL